MDYKTSTITITFGDMAENHVGMEKLGVMASPGEGFSYDDLEKIKRKVESVRKKNVRAQLHELSCEDGEDEIDTKSEKAYILIIKNGVDLLLSESGSTAMDLFEEQSKLDVDKKAFMYGRVVNKYSQWNLCFDTFEREPDYPNRKGRIVSYQSTKILNAFYNKLPEFFGEKANSLKGEGNYYYDVKKCGIGFHGDSERRKVIGVRLGQPMKLVYQWYVNRGKVGDRMEFKLNGGDIYIMSEKAVGTDWKQNSKYTLRHSAGCDKYTD